MDRRDRGDHPNRLPWGGQAAGSVTIARGRGVLGMIGPTALVWVVGADRLAPAGIGRRIGEVASLDAC